MLGVKQTIAEQAEAGDASKGKGNDVELLQDNSKWGSLPANRAKNK